MVRATLRLKSSKKSRPFKVKPRTTNVLQQPIKLKERLESLKESIRGLSTQAKFDKFYEIFCAENKNGSTKNKNSISDKSIELLEKRAELLKLPAKSKLIRTEIAKLSKEIRTNMRKDRQDLRMKTFETYIAKTGGIKKAIKYLSNKNEWIPNLKDNSGKNKTRRPDIISIATNFYKNLYEKKGDTQPTDLTSEDEVPTIIEEEVERAISTHKREKAPGPDHITNDLLIEFKGIITPILTYLFNDVLKTEHIPEQWTRSSIILLHKKGDKNDIGNYRPISLMSNVYKTFAKVILHRITRILDENQPREQAGFRSGYSTLDHIHVVRQVLEKYKEYQKPLYCCFVDYSKAFDSLGHDKIWQALVRQGVEKKYVRIIKKIYETSTAKVKLEREGEEIKINQGVRQGDPLSPKLFSAVLEDIFRELNWEHYGLNINGEKLNHLRFADDLIIFATTAEDLKVMIKDLDDASRKVGLIMNTSKTKAMTNREKETITVNDNIIEYVDEYVYLGQLISLEDLMTKEITTRIANAWKRYWSLKGIMKNKDMDISIKRKLYNTCVLPVLSYGCQTWALTNAHTNMLKVCQTAMERSMLGKKRIDKVRNKTIRQKTKVEDVIVKIRKLKWKWTGHTMRGQDKWSKAITPWYPRDGTRRRGRPYRRWADEVRKLAGVTWTRRAYDRDEWRDLEEAFANRQTEKEETEI